MLRINIPPITRALLATLITLSVLNRTIAYGPHLTVFYGQEAQRYWGLPFLELMPQHSLWYPWVIVTATLVEYNVFLLLIAGATILYGGRYLERAWNSAEFGKFTLAVAAVSNVLTAAVWVLLMVLGNERMTHRTIHGTVALQAGFLVAVKQLVPEHTVTIAKGLIKIRVKHFPVLFVLFYILIGLLHSHVDMFLAIFGFLVSWTYLRFYKVSSVEFTTTSSTTLRGDASETFAFASFFPERLQRPIVLASDVIYTGLVRANILTPFSDEFVESSNSQAQSRGEGGLPHLLSRNGGGGSAPGSARAEAERRRALALKALDERLRAASSGAPGGIQPSTVAAPAEPSATGPMSDNAEMTNDIQSERF